MEKYTFLERLFNLPRARKHIPSYLTKWISFTFFKRTKIAYCFKRSDFWKVENFEKIHWLEKVSLKHKTYIEKQILNISTQLDIFFLKNIFLNRLP